MVPKSIVRWIWHWIWFSVLSSSYVDSYMVSTRYYLLVNFFLNSCFLTRSTLKKYLVYYKWLHLIYEFIYVMNSYILLSVYSSVVIHGYEFFEFIEYMNWFVTWIPLFVWSHMWVWIWTRMDILDEFIYIWCNISDYV